LASMTIPSAIRTQPMANKTTFMGFVLRAAQAERPCAQKASPRM
jgi:hypothetical protein